jgi:hypothetical protein
MFHLFSNYLLKTHFVKIPTHFSTGGYSFWAGKDKPKVHIL